jgi:predicted RNA-binding Zn-ribbon protein involved in translation (DUF1610 family)
MQVRFSCPKCKKTHITDIPETTVHMTCTACGSTLRLRLTPGGDVKTAVIGDDGVEVAASDAQD